MPKAIFTCGWKNGSPDLPPLRDEKGGLQLVFKNEAEEEKGGFCVLGSRRDKIAIVLVFTSKATLQAMRADPKYLFLEKVTRGEDEEDSGLDLPTRANVVTFLDAIGVSKADLPTGAVALKRWLRRVADATDEAIDGADMT